MNNLRMQEKLEEGKAIDLSGCVTTEDGDYIVPDSLYMDGMDFCNAITEKWIWSIGERLSDGVRMAAHSAKFYDNPDFKCIWLR